MIIDGRVTKGIEIIDGKLHRPMPENAPLQMKALATMRQKGTSFAPQCFGTDDAGRLVLEFLKGDVPDNIGAFSDAQCVRGMELIRTFHDTTRELALCHGDLSPCNFVFVNGMPEYIIDWDACHVGDVLDDVAYALWMWLDAGNEETDPTQFRRREKMLLDVYGISSDGMKERMVREAMRVAKSVFPTEEQTNATRRWAEKCAGWIATHAL